MPNRRRAILITLLLTALCLLSLAAALSIGSLRLPPGEAIAAVFGGAGEHAAIVRELRLPRALSALACGALLALAGALMQVLLRNPLADPYVLGISGGAGVGAMLALLLGLAAVAVNLLAFGGALAAMLLVFGLTSGAGAWAQTRLLLTGVIIAAGCGALIALLLALAPEQQLRGMLFWLMGDLAQAGDASLPLLTLALGLAAALPLARGLNVMARGEEVAQTLGVDVKRLRRSIYLLASLLTAVAVTSAGSIGFIGLVVPHLVRLAVGNDQRLLLPAAALAGGAMLLIADTLARSVIAPQQLPVGVLTALIGVPVFLFLLARQKP